MQILLARHPELQKKDANEFVGQRDAPLSPQGVADAEKLSRYLADHFSIRRIFSSPLSRCVATARAVAEKFSLDLKMDPRLKEINLGRWQGKTLAQIFEENPAADLFFPPEGETMEAFRHRVESFFEELVRSSSKETVLVVAHAGVNKIILMRALGIGLEQFWDFPQDYAALSEIYCTPEREFLVVRLNDRSFLDEVV